MKAPRKRKKRKTGRPLEDVPTRTLLKRVKAELRDRIQIAMADSADKSKKD